MDFTAENVETAVCQFYQSSTGQAEINRWLTAAQVSQNAWSFASQLIQPHKSPEVQFFGANTLHVKIARFWNELPPDQVEPLRSHLLKLVADFSCGPRIVLTRLCIALSSFVLQTMPALWPNIVQDLVSIFRQGDSLPQCAPGRADTVLLEILTVLPEEFITAQLAVPRCHTVRNELKKGLPTVVQLLHGYLSPPASKSEALPAYDQALRCFASWAQFGLPYPESELTVELVFNALRQDVHFEVAVDTLIAIFSHPENDRFPQTMQRFLYQLVQTNDVLEKAIAERDMDVCQSLCRLIVMAADNSSKLIVALSIGTEMQRHLALSVISMVLRCSAIPGYYPVDERCSDFPFGFWYNFQDEILSADGERYLVLMQLYIPVFMQLVTVLLTKVQIPPDSLYNSWTAEEKELHRCYRQDIADTLSIPSSIRRRTSWCRSCRHFEYWIWSFNWACWYLQLLKKMYVYNLLHEPLLGSLRLMLESIISRSAIESVPWQEIETVLFAVTSLAEGVSIDENVHMPAIFALLAQIPSSSDYTLVNQALYFVGAFSEWLSEHPNMIGCVLPVLMRGLHDSSLAQSASMSLKDLVRECQLQLQPHANEILTVAREVLEKNILPCRDAARLMSCVGYVLAILPVQDILDYLNLLLTPHFDRLCQLSQAKPTTAIKAGIQFQIGLFSALFSSLNTDLSRSDGTQDEPPQIHQPSGDQSGPQPTVLVLGKLLPVLHTVVGVWVSDADIIVEICDTLKNSVRTLLADCAPLLGDLTNLILRIYEESPHYIVLDITKTVLVLFSRDAEHEVICRLLFARVCLRTVRQLQTEAHEHTDLLEHFMSFLAQVSKKAVDLLKDPACEITGLYHAGLVGLTMHELPTTKASCQFLAVLLGMGDQITTVNHLVASDGSRLVDIILRAIAGESPRANVDPMTDVLMALNQHHGAVLQSSLDAAVMRENFPSTRTSMNEKRDFARKVLALRVNKRKLKELVQEYTLLWRGLLGTEYAAQTAAMINR